MPNPTTKLAFFLFKERKPSQTYLELSSSRKCLAAGKVQERKRKKREKKERERRERREKIKARLKNKTLFTKAVNETYKNSPKAKIHHYVHSFFITKREELYIGNLMV